MAISVERLQELHDSADQEREELKNIWGKSFVPRGGLTEYGCYPIDLYRELVTLETQCKLLDSLIKEAKSGKKEV